MKILKLVVVIFCLQGTVAFAVSTETERLYSTFGFDYRNLKTAEDKASAAEFILSQISYGVFRTEFQKYETWNAIKDMKSELPKERYTEIMEASFFRDYDNCKLLRENNCGDIFENFKQISPKNSFDKKTLEESSIQMSDFRSSLNNNFTLGEFDKIKNAPQAVKDAAAYSLVQGLYLIPASERYKAVEKALAYSSSNGSAFPYALTSVLNETVYDPKLFDQIIELVSKHGLSQSQRCNVLSSASWSNAFNLQDLRTNPASHQRTISGYQKISNLIGKQKCTVWENGQFVTKELSIENFFGKASGQAGLNNQQAIKPYEPTSCNLQKLINSTLVINDMVAYFEKPAGKFGKKLGPLWKAEGNCSMEITGEATKYGQTVIKMVLREGMNKPQVREFSATTKIEQDSFVQFLRKIDFDLKHTQVKINSKPTAITPSTSAQ